MIFQFPITNFEEKFQHQILEFQFKNMKDSQHAKTSKLEL